MFDTVLMVQVTAERGNKGHHTTFKEIHKVWEKWDKTLFSSSTRTTKQAAW
jgi:hypothetical protein